MNPEAIVSKNFAKVILGIFLTSVLKDDEALLISGV
jgi:hypothetical protein